MIDSCGTVHYWSNLMCSHSLGHLFEIMITTHNNSKAQNTSVTVQRMKF